MKLNKISKVFLLIIIPVLFAACEKDPDHPPKRQITEDALMTVQQVRDLYTGDPVEITGEAMFFATVIMDENLGNIHRSLIVQDETAGIFLRLTTPSRFNEGDSVRIALDGATLDTFNNMLQLNDVDPSTSIITQAPGKDLSPQLVTIPEITTDKQSQLVKLENVQFSFEDTGKTYADAASQQAMSRTLMDCDGNSIIVRTSGFADFADEVIPEGNGTVVAVVTQYQNTMQLFIRNTGEVHLEDDRCPPPGGDHDLLTIADIRQKYADGHTSLPPNTRLEGVVISNREYENHPGQNAYIMDEHGDGIALRFQNWHNLNYGNEVRVITSNIPINEFNGLLQIEQLPTGNAYAIGDGEIPEPVITTIQNLRDNFSDFESALITIENASVPSSNAFEGNVEISDGTGSVNIYTHGWAAFADTPVEGGIYNVTAIASFYFSPQLLIRSLDDMEYVGEDDDDNGDVDPVTYIDEDFQGYSNFDEIDQHGWSTVAEVGGRKWICRMFDGNHYAQATAFNSPDPNNIMWMITPPVDLDAIESPVLEFQSAHEYLEHDAVDLYISTDFDGGDPTGATWTALDARLADPDDAFHTWIDSGIIDLSNHSGIIYIAWRYEGSHPDGTNGSFRVDNVKLYDAAKGW